MVQWMLGLLFCCQITQAAMKSPLIIGHRGASGHRPEHTLESYKLAIKMGADYIEPDLVSTKDHVLIARHENEISGTTDVASKFPDRKATKTIDGVSVTGWFTEDFTLKEIKTLRANERLPFRNHKYDGKFEIPTLEEVIKLAQKHGVGIYPETKHPTYFQSINLPLEEPLVEILKKNKWDQTASPVFIQSFELTNLKKLKKMISVPLIFLLDSPEKRPYDFVVAKDKRTYLDLITQAESIKELVGSVNGIGPNKRYIVPVNKEGQEMPATELIEKAHAVGLKVHTWTFRNEDEFLLKEYKKSPQAEYKQFLELGVDGLFSDFPDEAFKARKQYLADLKKIKKPKPNTKDNEGP